jgi:hypothetical protein
VAATEHASKLVSMVTSSQNIRPVQGLANLLQLLSVQTSRGSSAMCSAQWSSMAAALRGTAARSATSAFGTCAPHLFKQHFNHGVSITAAAFTIRNGLRTGSRERGELVFNVVHDRGLQLAILFKLCLSCQAEGFTLLSLCVGKAVTAEVSARASSWTARLLLDNILTDTLTLLWARQRPRAIPGQAGLWLACFHPQCLITRFVV